MGRPRQSGRLAPVLGRELLGRYVDAPRERAVTGRERAVTGRERAVTGRERAVTWRKVIRSTVDVGVGATGVTGHPHLRTTGHRGSGPAVHRTGVVAAGRATIGTAVATRSAVHRTGVAATGRATIGTAVATRSAVHRTGVAATGRATIGTAVAGRATVSAAVTHTGRATGSAVGRTFGPAVHRTGVTAAGRATIGTAVAACTAVSATIATRTAVGATVGTAVAHAGHTVRATVRGTLDVVTQAHVHSSSV